MSDEDDILNAPTFIPKDPRDDTGSTIEPAGEPPPEGTTAEEPTQEHNTAEEAAHDSDEPYAEHGENTEDEMDNPSEEVGD